MEEEAGGGENRKMGGCVFQLFYSSPSGGYIENSNEKKGKRLKRKLIRKAARFMEE